MAKPNLIFVCPSFPTFIRQDIEILSSHFSVTINHYNWHKKSLAPFFLFAQFFFLLFHLPKSDAVIVHFGGYWSLFPSLLGKIFNKPVYIVLHGTDCASIPELQYGSLRLPLLKWFCGNSYKLAKELLPVSESLVFSETYLINEPKGIKNGFKYHFPSLNTPFEVIPNGFDINFWTIDDTIRIEKITFIAVMSESQFVLKGGDLIVEAAGRFEGFLFFIAGMDKPVGLVSPENLQFLGRLAPEVLRTFYQRSSFVLQLSIFEGFGCALCEAMLCGCIPIGSEVNEIPTIIGETGYLLNSRSINDLEKVIEIATSSPIDKSFKNAPRSRIIEKFRIEERAELLYKVLSKR